MSYTIDMARNDLLHMRRISFFILVGSITVIYFSASVSHITDAIHDEIIELESVINMLDDLSQDKYLFLDITRAQNVETEYRNAVSFALSEALNNNIVLSDRVSVDILFKQSNDCNISLNSTLRTIKARMEDCQWSLFYPKDVLIRELSDTLGVSWGLSSGFGKITLQIDDSLGIGNGQATLAKNEVMYAGEPDPPIVKQHLNDILFDWSIEEEQITLDEEWFSQSYPQLIVSWNEIKSYSLYRLLKTYEPTSLSFKFSRELELMGIKIDSIWVGSFAPIAIFISMLYLYQHVRLFGTRLSTTENRNAFIALKNSPWLANEGGCLSGILSILQISIVPAIAIYVCGKNLLLMGKWISLLLSVGVFVLGCATLIFARSGIDRENHTNNTVTTSKSGS